jgi:hypothetical protein
MNVKKDKILQDFASAEAEAQAQINAATDAARRTALTQELEGLRQKRRTVELTACGGEFLPSSLSPIGDSTTSGSEDV